MTRSFYRLTPCKTNFYSADNEKYVTCTKFTEKRVTHINELKFQNAQQSQYYSKSFFFVSFEKYCKRRSQNECSNRTVP